MAPRTGARVKIVSPNSGNVTLSRSASAHSSRSHGTHASSCGSAMVRQGNSDGVRGGLFLPRAPFATVSHNSSLNGSRASSASKSSRTASAPERTYFTSGSASGQKTSDRAKDQEAIHRAQEMLEAAGRNVLRRPFGGNTTQASGSNRATGEPKDTATKVAQRKQQTSSSVLTGVPSGTQNTTTFSTLYSSSNNTNASHSDVSGKKRAMQLPQSILGAYRPRSGSRSTFADTTSRGSSMSSYKRPRSASATMAPPDAGNPFRRFDASLLRQRKGAPEGYTPASLAAAVGHESGAQVAAPPPPATPRVCPGMFSGLSAIPLSEKLFDNTDANMTGGHQNYYPSQPSRGNVNDQTATVSGAEEYADSCPRRCVRPLWSLVGTFKTGLTSVVNVDYGNDCLNWQQRSPKGGFQRIRVPLHAVLDAMVVRVVQEDEDIRERQFTVVVRTSARPSQVVFGFRTVREANEFRAMMQPKNM